MFSVSLPARVHCRITRNQKSTSLTDLLAVDVFTVPLAEYNCRITRNQKSTRSRRQLAVDVFTVLWPSTLQLDHQKSEIYSRSWFSVRFVSETSVSAKLRKDNVFLMHSACGQSNCFFPDLIIMSHPTHLLVRLYNTAAAIRPSAMHIRLDFHQRFNAVTCSHNDPHYISRRYRSGRTLQIFSSVEKYPVRHK